MKTEIVGELTTKQKANELLIEFSECGEDNEMYIVTAKNVSILCVEKIMGVIVNDGTIENQDKRVYWQEILNHLYEIES